VIELDAGRVGLGLRCVEADYGGPAAASKVTNASHGGLLQCWVSVRTGA